MAMYSRGIRVTASGVAINRPTVVSALSVRANQYDVLFNLRDGGATGPIVWDVEADNAAGSSHQSFPSPLRFYHNVYVEVVPEQTGGEGALTIAVDEP